MEAVLSFGLVKLIGIIFAILAVFAGGNKWAKRALKAKVPLQESVDVLLKVRAAQKKDSPGGRKITTDEWKGIAVEGADVLEATIFAVTGKTVDLDGA